MSWPYNYIQEGDLRLVFQQACLAEWYQGLLLLLSKYQAVHVQQLSCL